MKTKNKLNLSLLILVVSLVSILQVVSALTLASPADSSTISGTTIINATAPAGEEIVNCTFYVKSASTANSTWTSLGTFNNDTTINVNGTFSSAILEDSNDYQFNATCRNQSNNISDVVGGANVVVNNTVPTTPSSLSPSADSTDNDGSISFSATVTGSETTGCTLYFSGIHPGNPSYTMTHTGNTCTYSLTSVPEQSYDWYVRASDGTDTTDSSTQTFNVDVPSAATRYSSEVEEAREQFFAAASESEGWDKNTTTVVIVILVVLGIGYWMSKKK